MINLAPNEWASERACGKKTHIGKMNKVCSAHAIYTHSYSHSNNNNKKQMECSHKMEIKRIFFPQKRYVWINERKLPVSRKIAQCKCALHCWRPFYLVCASKHVQMCESVSVTYTRLCMRASHSCFCYAFTSHTNGW